MLKGGNLYQLKVWGPASPGTAVVIDGPHDTFGLLIMQKPNGYWLIRGVGHGKASLNVPEDTALSCGLIGIGGPG